VRTPLSLTTQVGRALNAVVGTLPGPSLPDLVPSTRTVGTLLALAAAVALTLRAPRGVPRAAVRVSALAALWLVVLSPVVHHWYVLWCLPLLAACSLGPRADSAVLHVGWLGGLVAPLDSSLAGAGTVIAVAVALVAAASLVQARVHRVIRAAEASGRRSGPSRTAQPLPGPRDGARAPGAPGS
jgi:hypothetical protein